MIEVRWLWMFIDSPQATSERAWAFWAALVDAELAPRRGDHNEFSTLLPSERRPYVKLQAIGGAVARTHLDIDVDDTVAASEWACETGAELVTVAHGDVHVMRSPGGYEFCLTTAGQVDAGADNRDRPDGRVSVGQFCLDVAADEFEREVEFWHALTGWAVRHGGGEFVGLDVPDRLPFRFLIQRLDDPQPTDGHPDLIVWEGERAAAVASAVELGAAMVGDHGSWTVLRDPSGLLFCLCDPPS